MDVFSAVAQGPSRAHLRAAAIQAAQALGVFERLVEEPRSAEELAWNLGLESEHRLQALLDVLVLEGLLTRDVSGEDATYALRALVPAGTRLPPLGWGRLAEVIRSGAPLDEAGVRGVDSGGDELRRFHAHLCSAGAPAAAELMTALAQEASWSAADASETAGGASGPVLLDLGSGAGAWSKAWLEARPDAQAILLDRPDVLALAESLWLAPRAQRLPRELLDEAPWPRAQVVLLANLLHLFGPDEAQGLVSRAAEACAPGGLVVIKDLRLDDGARGPASGVLFSLNMALFTAQGRVHTQSALLGFLRAAGLVSLELRELASAPDALVALGRKPHA